MSPAGKPPTAGCACVSDPFADLPPELRPEKAERAEKVRRFGLRQATCPICGTTYTTNRETDVCIECERRGAKVSPRTEGEKANVLTIKVLGPGCEFCERLEQTARQALDVIRAERPQVEGALEKVTDAGEFMRYGLLVTPGLVINEKLVCAGRLPATQTVAGWLREALEGAS